MSEAGAALGARLRERDLSAAPAALNLLESTTATDREQAHALLAEISPQRLGGEAAGHLIGVTGPPGAGKSTLLSALVAHWRAQDRTVAVLAIDPSSRRSGGSLLGDRARICTDPGDPGVLIRSTAAGERLGGLAPATALAAHALAAAFDVVVIETVGVGQAETDVAEIVDTVLVVVQPGSGDVLQFLKAGIMETPDVLAVTKADLGELAARTRRELSAALSSLGHDARAHPPPVLAVSALPPPNGVGELADALDGAQRAPDAAHRARARRATALHAFTDEHGQRGVRALGGRPVAQGLLDGMDPGLDVYTLLATLETRACA